MESHQGHAHLEVAQRLAHDVLAQEYGVVHGRALRREQRARVGLVVEQPQRERLVGGIGTAYVEAFPQILVFGGFAVYHLVVALVELVQRQVDAVLVASEPI